MLSHLTKKDLRQTLKFTDPFHRTSFYFAVEMLKKLNYNLEEIERRRLESKLTKTDVVVGTRPNHFSHVQTAMRKMGIEIFSLEIR